MVEVMAAEIIDRFCFWQWKMRLLNMKLVTNPNVAYGLGPFPVHDASHTRTSIYRFAQYEFPSKQAREAAAERIAAAAVRFNLR
jgi:hypothetical protein